MSDACRAMSKGRLLPGVVSSLGTPYSALASGLLLALAFPRPDWAGLAWVALLPLLTAVDERTPAVAFRRGWLSGLAFYLGTLYWIVPTIAAYTPIPAAAAVLPLVLLSGVLAAYTGAFAAGTVFAARHGVNPALFAPLWWVALEWLRSWFLTGFPWVSLGYSQYRQPALIQIAEITGVYGVSALVVLFNVVVFTVLRRRGTPRLRAAQFGILTLLLLGVFLFGTWRPRDLARRAPAQHLRAAVIQGNIPQHRKWDPAYQEATVGIYERLSRDAARQGATLIVWPETAAPFFFQLDGPFAQRVRALARETGTWLLFGSPAFAPGPDTEPRLRNRAYLLTPDGEIAAFYDKVHLVPFGEYVPLPSLLFFLAPAVEGFGGFVPGAGVVNLPFGPHRAGPLICYEAIFPALARRFVAAGADVLVSLTNDAWYGDTSAPDQHLAMAALRAVENRVPVIRAANTGFSAFVHPDGRILERTELFTPAVRVTNLAWPPVETWYTRHGDVFALGCSLGSVGILLACLWRRARGIYPARRFAAH